ncbi:hypothetical protein R50072_39510 [Simiduia litorea]|uniref:hypothetical protein n=1 Tax=Simiduia litorea TaxID=1435348 RepID=UPI0036F2CDF8
MLKSLLGTICIPAVLPCASNTTGAKALTAIDLASVCNTFPDGPKANRGTFCLSYNLGFIDGAVALDQKAIQDANTEAKTEVAFIKSAARIRGVGSNTNISANIAADSVIEDLKLCNLVKSVTERAYLY